MNQNDASPTTRGTALLVTAVILLAFAFVAMIAGATGAAVVFAVAGGLSAFAGEVCLAGAETR